jgi:hypothetical protein
MADLVPPPSLSYYQTLAEKAASESEFTEDLFTCLCTDFNRALKLAEGNLRIRISKRFYGLVLEHHIRSVGEANFNPSEPLLGAHLLETSPDTYCLTIDPARSAPVELQKILYVYMKDCMHHSLSR